MENQILKDRAQYEYMEAIHDDCLMGGDMSKSESWTFAFWCWKLGYNKIEQPTAQAVQTLTNALKEDHGKDSYYNSWQANIACAIMDTMPDQENIVELANEAAKRFLDILIS